MWISCNYVFAAALYFLIQQVLQMLMLVRALYKAHSSTAGETEEQILLLDPAGTSVGSDGGE